MSSKENISTYTTLINEIANKKATINKTHKTYAKINLLFLTICYTFISIVIPKTNCGPNNKCYILALEGGGDKGAYQAGAIAGLIANLNKTETQYDVVTGISVGAINAAGFSIFSIGYEQEAADFLLNYWREIKGKSEIFENWMFGALEGLLFKTGLYTTSPLKTLLEKLISGKSLGRKLIIGSTDISNGTYKTWDEKDFADDADSLITSVMASSAFPVIFPNIEKDGTSYMDGGVKTSIDIFSGINKCLDMGYSFESIVIDAILCSAADMLPQVDLSKLHPVTVLMRVMEIYGYDNSMRDLEDILYDFPKTNFRYIIAPTKKLPSSAIPLTFKPEDIEKMIEIGIEDAKDAIKNGETLGNAKNAMKNYRNKRRKKIGVQNMNLLLE